MTDIEDDKMYKEREDLIAKIKKMLSESGIGLQYSIETYTCLLADIFAIATIGCSEKNHELCRKDLLLELDGATLSFRRMYLEDRLEAVKKHLKEKENDGNGNKD